MLLVAKVLGDRKARKRHAQARPWRFVHLAVDQRDLRRAQVLLVDDAGARHFVVQVVTFARALADAGEDRHTAVQLGDVVDQLHDDDGFPHAGPTERADLAAFQEGTDQIDHLDTRGEHLRGGRLVRQRRGRAVDRIVLLCLDRPAFVDRGAGHVEHATQDPVADRHADWRPAVLDLVSALEALRTGHGDASNTPVAEVLLHLERHRRRVVLDRILDRQRAVDRGECFGELDVHHRPDDLNDLSRVHASASRLTLPGRRRFPAALG